MACSDQVARRFCPPATKATPGAPGRSFCARLRCRASGARRGRIQRGVRRVRRGEYVTFAVFATSALNGLRGLCLALRCLPPWRSLGMVGVARRQHNRPCVGDQVRLDRERHRAVRAHRIPRPRAHFRSCRCYSSFPRSGAATSIDGLTCFIPRLSDCRCSREQPHVESSCL